MATGEKSQHDDGGDEGHGDPGKAPKPPKFEIKIDRMEFEVHQTVLTGAQLRDLPKPPIGPDRDLFEVVPGGSDLKIAPETQVIMRDGLRFFTAPAQINPGQA